MGSKDEPDYLVADFQGLIDQHANLVGITEIVASVQVNIYEVYDQEWVKQWREGNPQIRWTQ